MIKPIGMATAVVALGTAGSAVFGGTALASAGVPGGINGSPAHSWVTPSANNCVGNSFTIKNGQIVLLPPNCTSSSTSTNGSGGSGGSGSGSSSQGTTTNNCAGSSTKVVNGVVTTSNGCTASATGTGGTSH
jgi:hypothetical protein